MRILLCVSWALVRRTETEEVAVNEAGVTAMVQGGTVRGEAGMMAATCCGVFQSGGVDAEIELCLASRPPFLQGQECDALKDGFPFGVVDMGDCGGADLDLLPLCVKAAEAESKDAETDGELVDGDVESEPDAEIGASCEPANPGSCGAGLVCSKGKCKYAAMEICKPTWGTSKCASDPYGGWANGAGHHFNCKTHRKWGDKRCCIPGVGKNYQVSHVMLANNQPLTMEEYQAAHPDRTHTKDGKEIRFGQPRPVHEGDDRVAAADVVPSVSITDLEGSPRYPVYEPMPALKDVEYSRRGIHRRAVPRTGRFDFAGTEEVWFANDACCSGWATYGIRIAEVGRDDQIASKTWFCGW